jgi:hypothetical protein
MVRYSAEYGTNEIHPIPPIFVTVLVFIREHCVKAMSSDGLGT